MKHCIVILLLLSVSTVCWAQSAYWTGDGGKGMSLAILTPDSQGLPKDLAYLPAMVQGCLVSNISKYSGIAVLDRVALDKVIAETLDPAYKDNLDIVRLGHVAQTGYIMTGKLIKTASGYTMQINVTDTTPNSKTTAAYSGSCTVAQLDDQTAIQKASLDLLTQMGVRLTDMAKRELNTANSAQSVNAQTALAQGITAQKQGTEVAAMSYFYQATALDPSLLEAAKRSSVISANISSGNIGADARNDIQWRRDWVARLTEFEEFFYRMINAADPPYTLCYSTGIQQGRINYQAETIDLSISTNLRANRAWLDSIRQAAHSVYTELNAGLNATGRRAAWELARWPEQGLTGNNPFAAYSQSRKYDFSIAFELVNEQNRVIGKQTVRLTPFFDLSRNNDQIVISYTENNFNTVTFNAVKANDISDKLTIRVASVNGAAPKNARFPIMTLSETQWHIEMVQIEMVQIPGGSFQMGKGLGTAGSSDITPVHTVTLTGFYIGKYEVTQEQYQAVMGGNPSYFHGGSGREPASGEDQGKRPVEQVSWYDAIVFCNKLSMAEGLSPAYSISGSTNPSDWGSVPTSSDNTWNAAVIVAGSTGYRLPTEAQWEYAARGGDPRARGWVGYRYSGSNTANDVAWYSGNSSKKTHEVGKKSPNGLGLYDMSGNVWEWCWDWYGAYSNQAQTDPAGAASGSVRVLRGGSWGNVDSLTRSVSRISYGPSFRGSYGFRLVRP